MNVQRDTHYRGKPANRTKPRLSAAKKEELAEIMGRLRSLVGKQVDKDAHTVQIVFTSEKHESVLTFC